MALRDEKVAVWYINMLLFEHFSLTHKNLATSEIAFSTWLPPGLKETAGTQHQCGILSILLTQLPAAWLGSNC